MFDYELHQLRTAELAQQATHHRLVQEALKTAAPRRRTLTRALGREAAEARLTAQRTTTTTRHTDHYTRAA